MATCKPDGPCCPKSSRLRSRASNRLSHMPDRGLAERSRKHWPSALQRRDVARTVRRALPIACPVAVGAELPLAVCARPRLRAHQQRSNASAPTPHKVGIDRSDLRQSGTCRPKIPLHHRCCQVDSPTPCKQEMPRRTLQQTLPAASLAVRDRRCCRQSTKSSVGLVRDYAQRWACGVFQPNLIG